MSRKKKRAEPRTIEQAQALAAEVARGFKNLECAECVIAIARRLGGESACSFVRLRTADNSDLIAAVAEWRQVSANKCHVGLQIGEIVIDNVYPDGVPADVWAGKFTAATRALLLIESRRVEEFFTSGFQTKRFKLWLSSPILKREPNDG